MPLCEATGQQGLADLSEELPPDELLPSQIGILEVFKNALKYLVQMDLDDWIGLFHHVFELWVLLRQGSEVSIIVEGLLEFEFVICGVNVGIGVELLIQVS